MKMDLKKRHGRMAWMVFCSEKGPVAGFCEKGYGRSFSTKCGKFLD
jgi:hypothetical protein